MLLGCVTHTIKTNQNDISIYIYNHGSYTNIYNWFYSYTMVVASVYWSLVPSQHMSQGTHRWIKQIMPQWRQHLPRRSARMPLSAMPILQLVHFAKYVVKLPTSSTYQLRDSICSSTCILIYDMTVLLRSATGVVFCFGLRSGQVFLLSSRALRTVHSDASLCHALETVSQQPRRLRKTGSERAKSTAVFVSTYNVKPFANVF